MWNAEHRRVGLRTGLRYPSDVADEEWALVAPLIGPAKRGGRRRAIDVREVLNAIFYVLSSARDAMPARVWPSSTARAPKPPKRGQKPRSTGLRCWQEGHGPQAPHPRRHARPLTECRRSFRRYPGPRWRGAGARQTNATTVPLHRAHLRRWRLPAVRETRRHFYR